MASHLLFCKCVILLIFFKGVVCPLTNLTCPAFSTADIYEKVIAGADNFIFEKKNTPNLNTFELPYSEISPDSLKLEDNNEMIVTFYQLSPNGASYNIKFSRKAQARYFIDHKIPPNNSKIEWARIYSTRSMVEIVDVPLEAADIGFKVLEPFQVSEAADVEYFFKLSELDNHFKIARQTLIMRNKENMEDYCMTFSRPEDMQTFVKLFPRVICNSRESRDYFYLPSER